MLSYGNYFSKGLLFSAAFTYLDQRTTALDTGFNMFAKSGTGFTPFWSCDDCGPVVPGNIGVSSIDAVGDFNGPSLRPVIMGNNYSITRCSRPIRTTAEVAELSPNWAISTSTSTKIQAGYCPLPISIRTPISAR